jgi:hypothetical protein
MVNGVAGTAKLHISTCGKLLPTHQISTIH